MLAKHGIIHINAYTSSQLEAAFHNLPEGNYLVYWMVRLELRNEESGQQPHQGRWSVVASTQESVIRTHDYIQQQQCEEEEDSLQRSFLDMEAAEEVREAKRKNRAIMPVNTRGGGSGPWYRFALGVLPSRRSTNHTIHTSFGWNPRWPRDMSTSYAGVVRLSVSDEIKRLLLLGMSRRKQQLSLVQPEGAQRVQHRCPLTKLNADTALIILLFL